MPTLDWIGKKAVVNHHREVPFHVLKEDAALSFGKKDSENLIVEGDNLVALKALLPYYAGKVKCIYIDPPYNTGEENWVYNDNVNSPEIKKWLGKVVGKEMEDLSRHDKWLCMMYPRLSLLKEFLNNDGIIFISIDDCEQHNLRILCDEIFGLKNFVANLLWKKKTNGNNMGHIPPVHDFILVYAKDSTVLNLKGIDLSPQYIEKNYKNPDNDPRGPWTTMDLSANHKGPYFGIVNPKTKREHFPSNGRYWVFNEDEVKKRIAEGRIIFGSRGVTGPIQKVFLAERNLTKKPETWIDGLALNSDGMKELRDFFGQKIFDHPKPSNLVKFLLNFSSEKNSLVLDSFAGSGTTAQAVLELNKEDGGNRKFILTEMLPEVAESITRERAKRVIERDEMQETTGFKFVKLGEPMHTPDGDINPNIKYPDLARHVFFMATGTPLAYSKTKFDSPLIGIHAGVAIYLLYNGILGDTSVNGGNRLTQKIFATLPKHGGTKIIYGTACKLSETFLRKHGIVFRQIPYTIFDR